MKITERKRNLLSVTPPTPGAMSRGQNKERININEHAKRVKVKQGPQKD